MRLGSPVHELLAALLFLLEIGRDDVDDVPAGGETLRQDVDEEFGSSVEAALSNWVKREAPAIQYNFDGRNLLQGRISRGALDAERG